MVNTKIEKQCEYDCESQKLRQYKKNKTNSLSFHFKIWYKFKLTKAITNISTQVIRQLVVLDTF